MPKTTKCPKGPGPHLRSLQHKLKNAGLRQCLSNVVAAVLRFPSSRHNLQNQLFRNLPRLCGYRYRLINQALRSHYPFDATFYPLLIRYLWDSYKHSTPLRKVTPLSERYEKIFTSSTGIAVGLYSQAVLLSCRRSNTIIWWRGACNGSGWRSPGPGHYNCSYKKQKKGTKQNESLLQISFVLGKWHFS